MSTDTVYTTGETNLLYFIIREDLKNTESYDEESYLSEFSSALRCIGTRLRSLSIGYLGVLQKKSNCVLNPIHRKMIDVIFNEPLDEMPLLLSTPIIRTAARFRLRIGR